MILRFCWVYTFLCPPHNYEFIHIILICREPEYYSSKIRSHSNEQQNTKMIVLSKKESSNDIDCISRICGDHILK
jgi:hypothetical protein